MTFLKEKLLTEIKDGKIRLKPKWLFIIRFFGLLIGALVSILISIFFTSVIIFLIFYNQLFQNKELLNFKMIFSIFPWAIIGLLAIFSFIFELFLKQLTPMYKKPILISILIIGLLVVLISFGINQNKDFKNLCTCGHDRIGAISWIFSNHEDRLNRFIKKGIIKEIKEDLIAIELENGNILQANRNLFCSRCFNNIYVADQVLISGEQGENEFIPLKIKKASGCSSCNMENEINNSGSCTIK